MTPSPVADMEYPYAGSDNERREIVKVMNAELAKEAVARGWLFIDVHDAAADRSGFLDEEKAHRCCDGALQIKVSRPSRQSRHLNGNSRSVSRTEHSFHQWTMGLTLAAHSLNQCFALSIRLPLF